MITRMKRTSFVTNNRFDALTGCWNWTGAHTVGKWQYGQMWFDGQKELVHRVSAHCYLGYALTSPLRVLHRCDNPLCFNPAHLFIGTLSDNIQDCISKGHFRSHESEKTHCPAGHPYSGDNLYVKPSGGRNCRQCHREQELARYHSLHLVS